MPITLSYQPGPCAWSRNPLRYTVAWSAILNAATITLTIRNGAAILTRVSYPISGTSGSLTLDLQNLVDPVLTYDKPLDWTAIVQETTATRIGVIELDAAIANGLGNVLSSGTLTGQWKVVKGGIGSLDYVTEEQMNHATTGWWVNMVRTETRFLTFLPGGRAMHPAERGHLLYLSGSNAAQDVRYTAHFTDGTSAVTTHPLIATTGAMGRAWYIAMGGYQASLIPAGKTLHRHFIEVVEGSTVHAGYEVRADGRPRYDARTLYFRNSMGGWDHHTFTGVVERSADVERSEYQRSRTNEARPGPRGYHDVEMTIKWKGNTGFLSRRHLAALTDLLLTTECAMLHVPSQRFLPMRITSKSLRYDKTSDAMQSAPLEWESAGTFSVLPYELVVASAGSGGSGGGSGGPGGGTGGGGTAVGGGSTI